uniref:Putative secreted protein n=1 Tax=Anopheles darlingi TaxID=43151 RepID=A0A2M4DN31_ANODA
MLSRSLSLTLSLLSSGGRNENGENWFAQKPIDRHHHHHHHHHLIRWYSRSFAGLVRSGPTMPYRRPCCVARPVVLQHRRRLYHRHHSYHPIQTSQSCQHHRHHC